MQPGYGMVPQQQQQMQMQMQQQQGFQRPGMPPQQGMMPQQQQGFQQQGFQQAMQPHAPGWKPPLPPGGPPQPF
jgi:hypothetical protein